MCELLSIIDIKLYFVGEHAIYVTCDFITMVCRERHFVLFYMIHIRFIEIMSDYFMSLCRHEPYQYFDIFDISLRLI